jgi:uncharacterized protein
MVRLLNTRTGDVLADKVELAETHGTRRRGLLGRDGLEPSSGLVLSPCWAVHTFFMRFSIDVIFLDAQDAVVRIVSELAPWRIAACSGARTTVELAAGALRGRDIVVGDRVRFVRADRDCADAPARVQEAPEPVGHR